MPIFRQRLPHLALPLYFPGPALPSAQRILISPLLMLRLRHNRVHRHRRPRPVHRHIRHIRGGHMPQGARLWVLDHRLHAHFHARPKRPVHARLQDQQIPHMHRCHKIQAIHACRHYQDRPRMPVRRHRPHQVDKLHQLAAKQIAQRVRITRKDDLAAFRLRFPHRPKLLFHTLPVYGPARLAPRITSANNTPMDKIATLSSILQQNPNDSFARYGLAMAHLGDGDAEAALNEFTTTTNLNPDYVPAYQMSAQTLARLNRNEAAVERLKAGLAAAQRTGNAHAASEMQALLDELESGY